MADDIKRYLFSCLVALGASLLSYWVTGYAPEIRVPAMVSVAIISFIISNTIFMAARIDGLKASIADLSRDKHDMRYFPHQKAAADYVVSQAGKCRHIKNTRLESPDAIATRSLKGLLSDHDNAIIAAVKKGCDYWLVYEKRRRPDIQSFIDEIGKARSSRATGQFTYHEMDAGDAPLIQIIILEYENGEKEALVGWSLGKSGDPTAPVFLFKSKKDDHDPVDLYERVFAAYQGQGAAQHA